MDARLRLAGVHNKLTRLIRTARKQYYADRFEDIRGDMKRTCQLIDRLMLLVITLGIVNHLLLTNCPVTHFPRLS